MNILLITLDQFRGDCLSAAGHPIVRTPHLDRLAKAGVRLARHYSQCAPCGPGRASLYTGMYQLNHRVVGNGAPLDGRFDNIAKAARRAGYAPTLFGYTDQAIDPRETTGPSDPRLRSYEEILPGFELGVHLPSHDLSPWLDWLREHGHDVPDDSRKALETEPDQPSEHSLSTFVADRFIAWMREREAPWFAHVSQLRPHPPYGAAGAFSRLYRAEDMPEAIAPAPELHPLHERLLKIPALSASPAGEALRALQAQYFGMVSEADHQLGRIWAALQAAGQWDETLIVVTADHGEQLGDHGLIQKGGFFEESYHILGVVRDPRRPETHGGVIDRFTENIDIFPSLCEAMEIEVPAQCDGLPLTPFLKGEAPPWWREAAHWEFDWRGGFIADGPSPWPWDRRLERHNLAVRRCENTAYVHFGDGSSLCFDLAADPTWRTRIADPAAILAQAQALLTWRARMADRTLTGMLVEGGGVGRWPEMPPGWAEPSP